MAYLPQETLLSHAYNGEDVRLMRALGDRRRGFYVEVGASDPSRHSVSRTFYDRGWHGIVVEPRPEAAAAFRRARPRDSVIEAVCSTRNGQVAFFNVDSDPDGPELSTSDPKIAEMHSQAGLKVVETTAEALGCDQILAGIDHVDFMVIDVEGAETDVIGSLLSDTDVRPDVLVVEAIHPQTLQPTEHDWQESLTAAGFEFVVFDGINRFYVYSDADSELAEKLITAPNPTDNYIAATTAEFLETTAARNEQLELVNDFLTRESAALRTRNLELEELLRYMEYKKQANKRLRKQNERLTSELESIKNGLGWRASRKVRRLAAPFRGKSQK